jgi:transposase
MLRMDQVFVIRHKVLVEGSSVRRVARELKISRNTVKRYLGDAPVGERRSTTRTRPVLDRVRPRIEALLGDSPRWTGGKQQLTAARLHVMLREEGFAVGETVVKRFVREWKRQRREVFVPLVYHPGDLAEVDFFEVLVDLDGKRRKAWMFVMRLMHSGRDFAYVYSRQDQVAFLDGHVRAFEHFGAVPQRIVYDNLKPAVARVLVGAERVLTARFTALASHYLFEASFARPATGHDKGGVESRGRAIRGQHLVPIPAASDLATMSAALIGRLDARAERECDREGRSILARFSDEKPRMLPLATHPFRAAAVRLVRASRRALCHVEGAHYSVPCRWAGLDVTAYVGAESVEIVGSDGRATHPRQHFGGRSVDYRHYLVELSRKPQAVRQVAAELVRDLGAPFDDVWRRLVDEHGPKQGARIFAQVLRAVCDLGERVVVERVTDALKSGEPILLALRPPATETAVAAVELPSSLQNVEVQSGRAADYDALLTGGVR